jgi:hypothetical protein
MHKKKSTNEVERFFLIRSDGWGEHLPEHKSKTSSKAAASIFGANIASSGRTPATERGLSIIIIIFFISLCCPVARIGEALLQISLLRPDSNFVFSLAPPSFCLLFAYLGERIKDDLFVEIGRLRRTLALVVLQKRERPCALPYEHAVAKR